MTSLILFRNRLELTGLPPAGEFSSQKISVCIPARNEEKTLPILLPTVLNQKDIPFEVIVLNDGSEDNTAEILQAFRKEFPDKLKVVEGVEKPDDWLGKPWACMQLSRHVSPDSGLILFLDADTVLKAGTLKKAAAAFEQYHADMITVWPQQILLSFWEKTIIPLIYYALMSILPSVYVYRKPRWMPKRIYLRAASSFAAANGQCIGFTKNAYEAIGGHEAVKQKIVEDVELAKAVKRAGFTLRMFHGADSVLCRMYENHSQIFSGLRKNFLVGFGNSLTIFIAAAILHLIVFIVPFIGLAWASANPSPLLFSLSAFSVAMILLHRLMLAVWFRWDPVYSITHPLGVLWFEWLGLVKIADYLTGRKSTWKGRDV